MWFSGNIPKFLNWLLLDRELTLIPTSLSPGIGIDGSDSHRDGGYVLDAIGPPWLLDGIGAYHLSYTYPDTKTQKHHKNRSGVPVIARPILVS